MRTIVISLLSHCTPSAKWGTSLGNGNLKPQSNSSWWTSSAATLRCSSVLPRALCGADSQKPTQSHLNQMELLVFLQLVLPLHGGHAVVLTGRHKGQQKARTQQGLCVKLGMGMKAGKKGLQTQGTPNHWMQETKRLAQKSKVLQKYLSSLM